MTTIPQTYDDKQVCEEAAKDWDSWGSGRNHICVKAPVRSTCACTGGLGVYPCECSVPTTDKGYVCQPGDTVCQTVK